MYFCREYSVKDLDKYLTKSEILDLLHILDASRQCINDEQIKKVVFDLKNITPFDCFTYGYITTKKEVLYSFSIDYPMDYLERYFENNYEQIDLVAIELIKQRRIINWRTVDQIYKKHPAMIVNQEANEFGLVDGFAYGGNDPENIPTFWFAGKHIERNNRSKAVIEFAVHALNNPLKELYKKNYKSTRQVILSKKEIEVLSWLKEGKSSWDISMIMGISERTVNFHVNNIITKLDAKNRTQAVAIAITEQLIHI
jgi:DNA-binding CsgD family transcriptional regulator